MKYNNTYTVNPLYDGSIPGTDGTGDSGKSGKTTIIYSGGSGLSAEDKLKLDGIEEKALVNQDAFSYLNLGDGTATSVIEARIPKDTAHLSIVGGGSIDVKLVTAPSINNVEATFADKDSALTYLFNYNKLETPAPIPPTPEVPPVVEEPPVDPPVVPEPLPPIITWPLVITYVSGDRTAIIDLSKVLLLSGGKVVDTISSVDFVIEGATDPEIAPEVPEGADPPESVVGKIQTITIVKENLYFDLVQFINTTTVKEVITDTILSTFNVLVYRHHVMQVTSTSANDLWKLDESGNIYTEHNAYSKKELSAYGLGPTEIPTNAQYLHDLKDVDKITATTPIDKGILLYNILLGKWVVTDGSAIKPDLLGYATLIWVTELVNKLIDDAPGALDTLNELAKALGDDPNFAATITGLINTLTIRVTDVENKFNTFSDMFEWDKSGSAWVIKAKYSLYSAGEITAFGYGNGDAPIGALYMHELKDVRFSSLTSGQLLKYDGTNWTNVNANEVGLNESQLAAYLTTNNYAKKSDIPSLVDYATRAWVTELGFAKQSIAINTGVGLVGGGNLTADRTLSLATIGIPGRYTRVTTDAYGRVTLGDSATIADIVGLQGALDSKLSIIDFNKWFTIEYNEGGTIKRIKALYDFYSVGEVSAYGIGESDMPIMIQRLTELKDVKILDPLDKLALVYNAELLKWINAKVSSDTLAKAITSNAAKTGHIETGTIFPKDMTYELIIRKVFYKPMPATFIGSISISNDVEIGTNKGTITYTTNLKDSGPMTSSYYINASGAQIPLTWGTADANGNRFATVVYTGYMTIKETYTAAAIYDKHVENELPVTTLHSTISVNVRRKWFAGKATSTPANSAAVRSLPNSSLIMTNSFKFGIPRGSKIVTFCIPSTNTVTKIVFDGVIQGLPVNLSEFVQSTVSVDGANGQSATSYYCYTKTNDIENIQDATDYYTINFN